MRGFIVFFIGFEAVLLQMTLLREFLAVFSGNELDIGITLAIWLISVGTGSFSGRTLRHPSILPILFMAVSFLCQPAFAAIQMIRPAVGAGLGEIISLPVTIGATVIILSPLCFLIGMLFPQAVVWFGGRAALVYGLEAAGSFLGAVLFSLFFAGKASPSSLIIIVAMLCCFSAMMTIAKRSVGAYVVLFASFVVILAETFLFQAKDNAYVVKTVDSRYGRIDLVKIGEQDSLFSTGRFLFSYPDVQSEEMSAHLPLTLHPRPSRVMLVGGSPAVVREMLKYSDVTISLVEFDPEVLRSSLALLPADDRKAVTGGRVRVFHGDARKHVKNTPPETYDLMVLNLPEPATANLNRFYTVEFFREARNTLRDGGVMVLSLPPAFGYVGRQLQLANGTIFTSLRSVFRHVEPSSGEYGLLAASDRSVETGPAALKERFRRRGVPTDYFRAELLDDVFDPGRKEAVRSRLSAVQTLNTDRRPVAYLYNLLVWAEMQGARNPRSFINIVKYAVALLFALAAGATAAFWRKRAVIPYAIFLSGGITMAFSVAVILVFQSAFGYVYEAIGLLTASFMGGMAAGAILLRGASPPLPFFRRVQMGSIVLLLLAPFLLKNEFSYYAVSFLFGAAGGGEFAAASRAMHRGGAPEIAGKLYAYDLAGSFLGALLCSVVLVPLFGLFLTLSGMVVVKISSLASLFSLKNETA